MVEIENKLCKGLSWKLRICGGTALPSGAPGLCSPSRWFSFPWPHWKPSAGISYRTGSWILNGSRLRRLHFLSGSVKPRGGSSGRSGGLSKGSCLKEQLQKWRLSSIFLILTEQVLYKLHSHFLRNAGMTGHENIMFLYPNEFLAIFRLMFFQKILNFM